MKSINCLLFGFVVMMSCNSENGGSSNAPYNPYYQQPESNGKSADLFTKEFQASDIVGSWNVSMNCLSSDCDGWPAGNIYTENWNINFVNGEITVVVSGNVITETGTTSKSYKGQIQDNKLNLITQSPGLKCTVVLDVINPNNMEGSREVLKSTPCAIRYSLKAWR
jgi:hypothetical protein